MAKFDVPSQPRGRPTAPRHTCASHLSPSGDAHGGRHGTHATWRDETKERRSMFTHASSRPLSTQSCSDALKFTKFTPGEGLRRRANKSALLAHPLRAGLHRARDAGEVAGPVHPLRVEAAVVRVAVEAGSTGEGLPTANPAPRTGFLLRTKHSHWYRRAAWAVGSRQYVARSSSSLPCP